jgi:hypothetical protein
MYEPNATYYLPCVTYIFNKAVFKASMHGTDQTRIDRSPGILQIVAPQIAAPQQTSKQPRCPKSPCSSRTRSVLYDAVLLTPPFGCLPVRRRRGRVGRECDRQHHHASTVPERNRGRMDDLASRRSLSRKPSRVVTACMISLRRKDAFRFFALLQNLDIFSSRTNLCFFK